MNLQPDLFSINNIFVPTKDKIIRTIVVPKKENNFNSSSYVIVEQKKFESIDIISIDPEKIDAANKKKLLEKKHNKSKTDKAYKESNLCKQNREKKWPTYLYDRMRANVRSKNKTIDNGNAISISKYNEIIANGFGATPPTMKPYANYPNFTPEFLLKLWEIQEGKDVYTNHPLVVSYKLRASKISCDRIDSNIGYEIGNVVLCCFTTNVGKNRFNPFSEEENSWMDYISYNDPIKKQEIRERIRRIQTLSME